MRFKKLITYLAVMAALAPCLLIANESDTFTPNIIGISYIICLMLIARTDFGQKAIDKIDKIIKKV